ncbi:unnamed protein product [Pylaiella littoralis]
MKWARQPVGVTQEQRQHRPDFLFIFSDLFYSAAVLAAPSLTDNLFVLCVSSHLFWSPRRYLRPVLTKVGKSFKNLLKSLSQYDFPKNPSSHINERAEKALLKTCKRQQNANLW